MITLQNVIFPNTDICKEDTLYLRGDKEAYKVGENSIHIKAGKKLTFDTYFNAFTFSKWCKYTHVEKVLLRLKGTGKAQIGLFSAKWEEKSVKENIFQTEEVRLNKQDGVTVGFDTSDKNSFYFSVTALDGDVILDSAEYITSDDIKVRNVKIALNICTYKREEYVERNVRILKEHILENQNAELFGNMEVFISDNGQTLDIDRLQSNSIHIVKNKNAGGAAGFTRGLIEILKVKEEKGLTHNLFMDDDVLIQPEALFRTYRLLSLLKEEYQDSSIGGAMMKLDKQYEQHEAGAVWNAGNCIFRKRGMDLREYEAVLYNEIEEPVDYQAWWYCCVPLTEVSESNLPLPMFIHQDDTEYGLRVCKNIIYLNGISVWHQSFENKRPSVNEYYDVRNMLIVNAVYHPEFTKKKVERWIYRRMKCNLMELRYQDIDMNIRAIKNFCGGIDWWENCDGSKLHQELMASGYKMKDIEVLMKEHQIEPSEIIDDEDENFPKRPQNWFFGKAWAVVRRLSWNGLYLSAKPGVYLTNQFPPVSWLYRRERVLLCDKEAGKGFYTERSREEKKKMLKEYKEIKLLLNQEYDNAVKSYRDRIKEVQSVEFWKKYLELEG